MKNRHQHRQNATGISIEEASDLFNSEDKLSFEYDGEEDGD